ncbi:MAG: twin-arginine translocase subunit TatC, partial [bacterium]
MTDQDSPQQDSSSQDSSSQDSSSQDSSSQDSSSQDKGQPLVDHLIELRTRLLHAILSVLIIFLPLFYVANDIYYYISEPLRQFLPEG